MKYFTVFCLMISTFFFAQKNEVKFNVIKILDLSYERKISEKFSAGAHLGTGILSLDDKTKNRLFLKTFGRYYLLKNQDFDKLYLQLAYNYKKDEYFPPKDPNTSSRTGMYAETAITAGAGYKFLIKQKFTIDLYIDVGPELSHPDAMLPIFADAGVNLGFRF